MWISEQTAIISLYNIKWLVFVTEIQRFYCAVWTEEQVLSFCSSVAECSGRVQSVYPSTQRRLLEECWSLSICL